MIHNPEVVGSGPTPATISTLQTMDLQSFSFLQGADKKQKAKEKHGA